MPPPLKKGARVALVAPSGPVAGEEDLERARENVSSLGWEPVLGKHAGAKSGYLAGSDTDRLEDLNAALADPAIDGIWCVRGGYGSMRLLDHIGYGFLRNQPRPLIGFSDITALHSAIQRRCGLVTFHGPTARGKLSDFSRQSLTKAVVERVDPCGSAPSAREITAGRATGRLAGGNLAIVAALTGTPYAPDLAESILVLEDVNEPLYRIDRMLQQLFLAGALSGCNAIAFGDCAGSEENGATDGLDDLLRSIAERLRIPCLAGIPVGHIPEQWTIPLGATATLDTAERKLNVVFNEA